MTDMEKNCPYCGEKIKQVAIKCPHCRSWLNQDKAPIQNIKLPNECKRFNWGAFCLSWIWGLGNKTYITFLAIPAVFLSFYVPVASLAVSIWFGIKGNEWAWKNNNWSGPKEFNRIQRNWAICGVTLKVVTYLFIITILVSLIVSAIASGNMDNVYSNTMKKDACVQYEAIKHDNNFSIGKAIEYQDLKEECGTEFMHEIIKGLLKRR